MFRSFVAVALLLGLGVALLFGGYVLIWSPASTGPAWPLVAAAFGPAAALGSVIVLTLTRPPRGQALGPIIALPLAAFAVMTDSGFLWLVMLCAVVGAWAGAVVARRLPATQARAGR